MPDDEVARVAEAHARLARAVEGIGDDAVRRPTGLPGWSVGHVLTHLARNADSHVRRVTAATRGEVVDQYPGGAAGRTAEIDAGATRSASELVADVRQSADAVDRTFTGVDPALWTARLA